jgi:lipopolysaccharide export system protein LptA
MIDKTMRALLAPGFARVCCVLICLGGVASPVWAEKADRDKPINFQGDTGGGNAETKNGQLSGNVVVTQGTLSIHADRITFHQNPDNSLSATAYGNPVTFAKARRRRQILRGFAQRRYDGQKRFVELFDNALLKKAATRFAAITFPTTRRPSRSRPSRPDSGTAASGKCRSARGFRGVFQPESKDAKDGKAPRARPRPPRPPQSPTRRCR